MALEKATMRAKSKWLLGHAGTKPAENRNQKENIINIIMKTLDVYVMMYWHIGMVMYGMDWYIEISSSRLSSSSLYPSTCQGTAMTKDAPTRAHNLFSQHKLFPPRTSPGFQKHEKWIYRPRVAINHDKSR